MSTKLFQGVIHQMKDAIDRVIGVISGYESDPIEYWAYFLRNVDENGTEVWEKVGSDRRELTLYAKFVPVGSGGDAT